MSNDKTRMIFAFVAAALCLLGTAYASSAAMFPGGQVLENGTILNRAVWVNVTKTNTNQLDEFLTCNNVMYISANVSCIGADFCGNTTNTTANFSDIGVRNNGGLRNGSAVRNGTGKAAPTTPEHLAEGSWAIFIFNASVECTNATFTNVNITNFDSKNITVNASNTGASTDVGWAGPLLVNMSTPPGCPPAGQEALIPSRVPLLNGTFVNINTTCSTSCSVDDSAQSDSAALGYAVCAPTFGPNSTNFTAVAFNGNFSNVNFTLDIVGKVRISIPNVDIGSSEKMNSIFQFAMKNMMSGGRIGVNDTEWNGSSGKPDLRKPARLTIYDFTGRFGWPSWRMPVISNRSTYGSGDFGACPANVCNSTTWDGQNLTFTVTGFSEYQIGSGIAVTLSNLTGASFDITTNTSYNNTRFISFSYIPIWNDTSTIKNATLWGNFSGLTNAAWVANNTNATPLVNGTVNWINTTVNNVTMAFKWNVVLYDVLGANDTNSANWTYVIEQGSPMIGDNTTIGLNATVQINSTRAETPNGTTAFTYAPNLGYVFNMTAVDVNASGSTITSGISKVLLNLSFASTNYSATKLGSTNNYSVTVSDLPRGNYTYRWFTNDSANNWNSTGVYQLNVTRNSSTIISLWLGNGDNTTQSNRSITYGNNLNISANVSAIYPIVLELNTTLANGWADRQWTAMSFTNLSSINVYALANNYNITVSFRGDANYTASSVTYWLNVTNFPTVTTTTSSGSSSPSSASTTPETTKTTKSFTSIAADVPKIVSEADLLAEKTRLTEVQLQVKARVTSVEMTVESFSAKPSATTDAAATTVYKYMSISFSNVAESNVQSAKVKFKVEKSWLTQQGIEASKVALYRYANGAWTKLGTVSAGEDSLYSYYEATTPGFSYFAIGSEQVSTTTTTVPSGQTTTTTTVPATTVTTVPGSTPAGDYTMLIAAAVLIAAIAIVIWKFKLIRL